MKTYKIYFISILCLLGFMACSEDDSLPVLNKVVASAIDDFPADE